MYPFFLLLATLLPTSARAEAFVPIAPIPNPNGPDLVTSGGVVEYLNTLFQFSITIGAVLAVIMIALGGFEYIVSQSTSQKKDGRSRILNALYGLGILLLVTLILYVINPAAICLDIFSNNNGCP